MTDRPTPEEIARSGSREYVNPRLDLLAHLRGHGYVIVHPDDVPVRSEEWRGVYVDPTCVEPMQAHGWNACRRHIFGGDQ